MLYHDSHDPAYRSPLGAVAAGGALTLRFRCDEGSVTLRLWDGAEHLHPMHPIGADMFQVTVPLPAAPMLLWYAFVIRRKDDVVYYGTSADELGGVGAYSPFLPPGYQVTVYDDAYQTPAYLRKGVAYQIFPDRFFRDAQGFAPRADAVRQAHPEATFHPSWNEPPALNPDPQNGDNLALDFFGGTLKGIQEKLDDLQALGVTVLYLNPIFRARTNHRYDTGSYEEIDPILGDESAFAALAQAAHRRGMHILLDGVFSHTGADSLYFNRYGRYGSVGAYQSPQSPYAGWYTFTRFPDQYRSWWGFYTLPELNKHNPSCRRYLLSDILPRWLRQGAGGWRLDVVDELPMDLVREMRQSVKAADENAVLLGEVWEDASNKVSYGQMRSYCLGDTLDSVMNYPLRRAVIDFFTGVTDAFHLRRVILHQQEVYPAPFLYSLMNLLGSHDRVRILNALSGYDRVGSAQMDRAQAAGITLDAEALHTAKGRYVQAVKLLCALPGMPTLYYGDEIGMTGMADPWNRAPMAWDDADESLRDQIASLLSHRRQTPLLQTGYLRVDALDADTIQITRYAQNGRDAFGEEIADEAVTVSVSRKNG